MFVLSLLLACAGPDKDSDPGQDSALPEADADGDGVGASEDCDDTDGSVAEERTWYPDADGDGYGADGSGALACHPPEGAVAEAGDCDDSLDSVHPGAEERCDSPGLDEDCDGLVDDEDPDVDPATLGSYWLDADGDGYGDPDEGVSQCDPPPEHVANGEDCDDTDANSHPGGTEVCDGAHDEDCDGRVDDEDGAAEGRTTWWRDDDGDGWGDDPPVVACVAPEGYVGPDGDCDDEDAGVNPGATEVCDDAGVDEDCDGDRNDEDSSLSGAPSWYLDADGDGYGDPAMTLPACVAPDGYVATGGDCDDARDDVSPAEVERCDAADLDEDCDTLADDADDPVTGVDTWWWDGDTDGLGGATSWVGCDPGEGWVSTTGDCDDANASVGGPTDWFFDGDLDGFGDDTTRTNECTAPVGFVATSGDCDDLAGSVYPGAPEWCDDADVDEDCDGAAEDDDPDSEGKGLLAVDADRDGYGGTGTALRCDPGPGFVDDASDCDDGDSTSNPGGTEVCEDGTDQDCDGVDNDCPDFEGTTDLTTTHDYEIWGIDSTDYFGDEVIAGDFDADGRGEILISALYYRYPSARGNGTVFAFEAPTVASAVATSVDRAAYFNDEAAWTSGPSSLTSLIDPGASGVQDFAVSPVGESNYVLTFNSGTFRSYEWWDGGYYQSPDMGIAGDILGDGSRYYAHSDASEYDYDGAVWLQASPSSTPFEIAGSAGEEAGTVLAGGWDHDGDGADDLWVAAADAEDGLGAVYLVLGGSTFPSTFADADTQIIGSYMGFGYSLGIPGDLDGDGAPDLVVGETDYSGGGSDGRWLVITEIPAWGTASDAVATMSLVGDADNAGARFNLDFGDADGDGELDRLYSYGDCWGLDYGPFGTLDEMADYDACFDPGTSVPEEAGFVPDWDDDGDDEMFFANKRADTGSYLDAGVVFFVEGR